jgi:hypothetical protein
LFSIFKQFIQLMKPVEIVYEERGKKENGGGDRSN